MLKGVNESRTIRPVAQDAVADSSSRVQEQRKTAPRPSEDLLSQPSTAKHSPGEMLGALASSLGLSRDRVEQFKSRFSRETRKAIAAREVAA
ncbi:MAG: hypothetical protein AAFY60_17360, partial [Myxococcota bacterium]